MMDVIWQALTDMVISGAGLLLVGGAYALCWLSGFVPNLFSEKEWSWKRGLQDFCKMLLAATILILGSGLADVGAQFFYFLGWDIIDEVETFSTFALIGAMSAGFVYYLGKAINNSLKFLKLKWNEKKGDKEQFEEGQEQIQEGVKEFIETITRKTSKEDFEASIETPEDGVVDVLDYEEVDPGMGGIANTYPNIPKPYRTAAQDTITDPSTCWNRECVSYTAAKIFELTGKWPTRTGGMNAKYWVQRLAENGYTKVVARPQNGGKYVGVSEKGEYGHVVWFEEGTTISEYNYLYRGGFSVRNIDPSAYKWVEIQAPVVESKPAQADNKPTVKNPVVKYTYKQGDTFGQVIVDLGLKTSHGLWGNDGDVDYYTNQLRAQGITGNIPVGKQIVLTPRV